MTEKVNPFFTMSTNDVPDGAAVSGIEVTLPAEKEQKPVRRGFLMPGSATVTLGSEKMNDASDSHN